jgi:hypothetical protein
VKNSRLPVSRSRALPDFGSFSRRVLAKSDAPEPVSAWRTAPEAELAALTLEEKRAFITALLPLVRSGRNLQRRNLRRLYQLFAFMEMPAAERLELLSELDRTLQAAVGLPPLSRNVRRSLADEAQAFASNVSSRAAFDYASLLRARLNVKVGNSRKLARLLERLTDIENRAATLLGKRGHIVRLDDRRLEVFKKSLAAVGVPTAIIFPLGTVGLSAEGISTGLLALGGGLVLPAGIAMVTGLGVAVAIGITTKRLLDMLMPTVDADRASIDVQQLGIGVVEIERLLDEVAADSENSILRERARERIAEIMQRVAPLTNAQRARIVFALDHARILGDRYLASLEHDRAALNDRGHPLAQELLRLRDLDWRSLTRS